MSRPGTRLDLKLNSESANPFAYIWTDGNREPIDFTGSTFKIEVKARDANGDPTGTVELTLETSSGITGTLADGEFNLIFPAEDDSGLAPGSYVYDCIRLVGGAAVEPMLWGNIDVNEGIATE